MRDNRRESILKALGSSAWFGGPSPAGSLRGVDCDLAVRRVTGLSHCIWELTLHIAYWEYVARRMLENGPKGSFPRSPANWPTFPETATENAWKNDRKLVKKERDALIAAIRTLDSRRLDEPSSEGSKNTIVDILVGVVQHSAYHAGQIALLKRLNGH